MARAMNDVKVLLSLKTAAARFGMKYDSMLKAVKAGRLRVRFAGEKPGGFFQPFFSEADLVRFRQRQLASLRGFDSTYHQRLRRKMERVDTSVPTVAIDDVLRPRPKRNGHAKAGASR